MKSDGIYGAYIFGDDLDLDEIERMVKLALSLNAQLIHLGGWEAERVHDEVDDFLIMANADRVLTSWSVGDFEFGKKEFVNLTYANRHARNIIIDEDGQCDLNE